MFYRNVYSFTLLNFIVTSLLIILPLWVMLNAVEIATFFIVYFYLGVALAFYLGRNNVRDLKNIIFIFSLATILYFSYSLVLFTELTNQIGYEMFRDQTHFHSVANSLKYSDSIISILKETVIEKKHIENEGAHFSFGVIAYISNKYHYGNPLLLQSLLVASFAVLINVFLYNTLRFYIDESIALKYTILFILFSFAFSYSPWILRDIHIMFFYSIGIYLVHKSFSVKVLLFLFSIQVILMEFRVESSFAFMFLPMVYIYLQAKNYKYKSVLYFICILLILPATSIIFDLLSRNITGVTDTLARYDSYTSEALESQSGLSGALYKLPFGIKHFSISVTSQIQPFPFWAGVEKGAPFTLNLSELLFGVSAVFWFYVMFINALFFKEHYRKIPKLLLYLLAFFCLFILANSSNLTTRRIIAVYPIAYVLFVFIAAQIPYEVLRRKSIVFILVYISLSFIYILLKGF
ncbi:hypothetical protein [Pseudoalteromonas nigrifaciens]|uniref:hypothetical protein n=1 Tax=Pseudoalteromonas nigrifaciens TaxID=28109 RepID=UPI0018665ABC|nr:hypothetical protein [Pseudoalteromonas nigrifaciens]